MPLVITPEVGIPLPVNTTPEEIEEFREKAKALCNTVQELIRNGAEIELTVEDEDEARQLFAEQKPLKANKITPGAVLKLEALLSDYDHELINAATRIRTYVTNRLLEESTSEKAGDRLRALELLGKIAEVGLFAEKVNVEVTHRHAEDIAAEILKRVETYIDAEVVENTEKSLLDIDLDAELGLNQVETEENDA